MTYEVFNRQANKPVISYFDSQEMADLMLPKVAKSYCYELAELGVRPTPKRVKPPTYTLANVPITLGENRQREKEFLLNPLGIVPYTVRTKENAGILLRSINNYNHEVGELRLEVVEITDDGQPLRHLRNSGAYSGTWTLWLKCNDLRALINLGREAQSEIFALHK